MLTSFDLAALYKKALFFSKKQRKTLKIEANENNEMSVCRQICNAAHIQEIISYQVNNVIKYVISNCYGMALRMIFIPLSKTTI